MNQRRVIEVGQEEQEIMEQECIPDQWYPIYVSSWLSVKKPVSLMRLGFELVLWRDKEGSVCAADAACPHRGANLGLGRVVKGELQCPYHGFRFDGEGACTAMPCEGQGAKIPQTMRLQKFEVREQHGFVWFWYGDRRREYPDIPWIPGSPEENEGNTLTREMKWDVRLSRVMEGMLDLHHFPFAHSAFTPPGMTRLEPYDAHMEGDVIRSKGRLRKENKPNSGFEVEFHAMLPGVLHIKFSDNVQAVVLCTPIDTENTWIVFRYHQSYVTLPIVGDFLTWFLVWSELKFIQPDDHKMLVSTNPRSSFPRVNHFVHADKAMAYWHRLRREALQK